MLRLTKGRDIVRLEIITVLDFSIIVDRSYVREILDLGKEYALVNL